MGKWIERWGALTFFVLVLARIAAAGLGVQ